MRQEFIVLAGKRYRYIDQAPTHSQPKETLLCLHGFPDQWYGWENQVKTWSEAGYRVILPHMLGYGDSDKPSEPSAYSTKNLCRDLALLLDGLELDQVVVVGHDWGALVAWRFALWYPHRTRALVAVSVVYHPPTRHFTPPAEIAKRIPAFAYQEFFADPNSTKEVDANLDVFLSAVFQSPGPADGSTSGGHSVPIYGPGEMQALLWSDKSKFKHLPMVISAQELQRYTEDFKRGGMNGPLSYYRNSRSRFDDEKEAGTPTKFPFTIPVLFIYGTEDESCQQAFVKRMPSLVPNLIIVPLRGKGHWLLREAPEEINAEVFAFLGTLRGGGLVGESIASVKL